MAGDWIAWTKGLTLKREVIAIANRLGLDRRVAACLCMEAWEWADSNTTDGHAESVTSVTLDAVTGVTGFGQAMLDVGWLLEDARGIIFPRWERWNAESAKKRLQNAERKRQQRQREHPPVTQGA
ncbi:MAG: hypothetical protein ISS78_07825 [Phycisphaerae bacterium]|nr:hypothetical protein [Phycisphaerae bacterium]